MDVIKFLYDVHKNQENTEKKQTNVRKTYITDKMKRFNVMTFVIKSVLI